MRLMSNECSCCAPRDVKRTLVKVGDATIGLTNLTQVFRTAVQLWKESQ